MLNTTPLQLQDGWSIASLEQAHLDARDISDLTRWIEESYEYHNIHSVLVEHAGHLVYEVYLEGMDSSIARFSENSFFGEIGNRMFSVDSLHDLASVSKSVTSILLGIALHGDYQQALTTPIIEFFKDRDIAFQAGVEAITLEHVLTMTAGFKWNVWTEQFGDPQNDNYRLFTVEDPIALTLGQPVIDTPGSVWKYNNGLTEVLSAIIEHVTGKPLEVFAKEALFEPLGISNYDWVGSAIWQPQGRPSAAGGLRMRARDLAKIGSLVLHNGVWNNRQIVSSEWLKLSTRRHVTDLGQWSRGNYGYGFQWWPGHSNSIPRYRIIAGFGSGGQQLLIIPDLHLVVTVFAGNYSRQGQDLFAWVLGRIAIAHRNHV